MKKDLYISLIAIGSFFCVNLLGASMNGLFRIYPGFDQLLSSIFLIFLFAVFHFVFSRIQIATRKTLRLPLIRTVFWTIIALPILLNKPATFQDADFIDAIIPSFCFLASGCAMLVQEIEWIQKTNFTLWGIYILGVSLYQILVLELTTKIVDKITSDTD